MVQKPVNYFYVSESDLLPDSAPGFKARIWDHWKEEGIFKFKQASPYINSDKPEGSVSVDCVLNSRKLSLTISEAIFPEQPEPLEFSMALSGFGSTFGKYLVARRGNPRVDIDTNDRQRREAHNRMAAMLVKDLKKAGLFFEDETKARSAFRVLTAYWFDLLGQKGLLVPQQGPALQAIIPVPGRNSVKENQP